MAWLVEYTDEFGAWWEALSERYHISIMAHVGELERRGPSLPFPYSSGIETFRHRHMRELRVQVGGDPIRIFYAFDPRRAAILLIGGNKRGDRQFYRHFVPIADRLYDEHLKETEREKKRGR
ncbi:MAG: addiction module toxin RelE [Alphaproteobacteria bacterium]|nr:addiction module toxin RelE [Alphaproteobacteria bacterium]